MASRVVGATLTQSPAIAEESGEALLLSLRLFHLASCRSRAFCSGARQHLQDGGQRHLPPNDGHPVRHTKHRDEGVPSSPAAQAHRGHLGKTEGSAPLLEKMSEALRRLLLSQQHPAWEGTLHRAAVAELLGSLSRAGTRRQLFRCFVD